MTAKDRFHTEDGEEYGSFEVFWHDGEERFEETLPAGWYWHACFPGCLPDGEANGPFTYSWQAKEDAET